MAQELNDRWRKSYFSRILSMRIRFFGPLKTLKMLLIAYLLSLWMKSSYSGRCCFIRTEFEDLTPDKIHEIACPIPDNSAVLFDPTSDQSVMEGTHSPISAPIESLDLGSMTTDPLNSAITLSFSTMTTAQPAGQCCVLTLWFPNDKKATSCHELRTRPRDGSD